MSQRIIVVSGPSGAGKTTVARLLAQSFDPSVHVPSDAFMPFVVNGWIDPWRAEASHQNEIMGAAVARAAIPFALGGYAVVLDGHWFPGAIPWLAEVCSERSVQLHYALLRPDSATCLARLEHRRQGDAAIGAPGRAEYADFFDPEALAQQHERFADLGVYESHVVDATGSAADVAAAVLAAVESGTLLVR